MANNKNKGASPINDNDNKQNSFITGEVINNINLEEDQTSLFNLDMNEQLEDVLKEFSEIEALSFAEKEEREIALPQIARLLNENLDVDDFHQLEASLDQSTSPEFPTKSYLTKDQISRKIVREPVVNQGEKSISIKYNNKDVTTKIALMVDPKEFSSNFPNISNVESAAQFDYYDRAIFNAIITLYLSGYSSMPYTVIHRVMVGSNNIHLHPTREQIERVKDSIKKMNGMWLDIDFSEEYTIFKKKKTQAKKKGRMIDVEFLSVGDGESESMEGISLIKSPLLFQYAKFKNQLATVNLNVLDVPVNMSKESIMVREYLNDRIESMKASTKVSRAILFDTLIKALPEYKNENQNSVRSYTLAIRKFALKILDRWVDIKYINGYDVQGLGKKKFYRILIDI